MTGVDLREWWSFWPRSLPGWVTRGYREPPFCSDWRLVVKGRWVLRASKRSKWATERMGGWSVVAREFDTQSVWLARRPFSWVLVPLAWLNGRRFVFHDLLIRMGVLRLDQEGGYYRDAYVDDQWGRVLKGEREAMTGVVRGVE